MTHVSFFILVVATIAILSSATFVSCARAPPPLKSKLVRNNKPHKKSATTTSATAPQHPWPRISWKNQPLRASPMIMNNVMSANLVSAQHYNESGFIGLSPITAAPFNANFQNSTILFNGKVVRVEDVTWGVCEGVRETKSAGIRNTVRFGAFTQRSILQRWDITSSNNNNATTMRIDMFLDGIYARLCDSSKYSNGCGWFTNLPVGRNAVGPYSRKIVQSARAPVMVTEDSVTNAVGVNALFVTGPNGYATDACNDKAANLSIALGPNHAWGKNDDFGYGFNASLSLPLSSSSSQQQRCVLWLAQAVDFTTVGALALLQPLRENPQAAFNASCTDSQAHFDSAFKPSDAGMHFSGSLPSLVVANTKSNNNNAAIAKLYDWALAPLVALERINYKSFPRQFVISEGPTNNYRGASTEGSSGQFVWDLSFAAVSYALLDPEWSSQVLTRIVANADFTGIATGSAVGLPQAWDSYTSGPISAGQYVFDFVATFSFIQNYVTYSGDYGFLTTPVPNIVEGGTTSYTPLQLLDAIAWSLLAYPATSASQHLRDYGDNKRDFLEAATTYFASPAAINAANAGMMLSLANLYSTLDKQQQSTQEINNLRGNATAIVADMLKYQFDPVSPTSAAWKCLADTDVPGLGSAWQVRSIVDTIYIPFAQLLADDEQFFNLPQNVRESVIGLFWDELMGDGWPRALSLKDPSESHMNCKFEKPVSEGGCTNLDLVAMRSDWTATGSYGGVAGLAVDSLAQLGSDFESAIRLLRNLTIVTDPTKGTMPAQGMAVMTPPAFLTMLNNNDGIPVPTTPFCPGFAEFFDPSANWGSPWARTSRSVQNAEAAIADAIVRSIFGWRPTWNLMLVNVEDEAAIAQAITSSLWRSNEPRADFAGTLKNVRTPFATKMIDITAGPRGLSWAYSQQ